MALTEPFEALAGVASLDELYAALGPRSITAGWHKPVPSLWPEPRKTYIPMHWTYREGKAALDAAGRLIDTSLAERRNLILFNPVEGNAYATARTIITAYQMILPGERARSHRHTPNALRLIIDSEPGTYSTVDGVKVPMETGDVVLTPSWMWHGHGNEGRAPAYWIDYLDAPLTHLLEPMFLEWHPDEYEPIVSEGKTSPLLYRWSEIKKRLADAPRDPSERFGRQITFDSHMPTLGLHMCVFEAGEASAPLKTTANNVYSVVSGRGTSTIDDRTFAWERGDVFVAPSWREHRHQCSESSVLFRVTDEPLLAAIGWLR